MKTESRHSYGVIPLIGTPGSWRLLVIDQKDPRAPHHWTLAKGTPEEGEEPRRTAIRETYEEVGIICDALDGVFAHTHSYEFEQGGVLIQKSVTYFAGRAPDEAFTIQESEVGEARWCTPEEAKALITFPGTIEVIDALIKNGVADRLLK
jgi:8-oxo-(d)GTP phosphatase